MSTYIGSSIFLLTREDGNLSHLSLIYNYGCHKLNGNFLMGLEKFDLLNNSSNTFIHIELDIRSSLGGKKKKSTMPKISEFCVQQKMVYILMGR